MAIKLGRIEEARGSSRVERQAKRLASVLRAYERILPGAYLEALVFVSLFRRPVAFSLVRDILTGGRIIPSLEVLSSLKVEEVLQCLHVLKDLKLVDIDTSEGEELFSSHPFIRDYFLGTHLSDRDEAVQEVSSRYVSLIGRPGRICPLDLRTIVEVEEAIFLSILAKRGREAYQIYKQWLGGYLHLGWELGYHVIGAEIAQALESDLTQAERARLLIDEGLFFKNLGWLTRSSACFSSVANSNKGEEGVAAQALQNLSAVQVLQGHLISAEMTAILAVEAASRTNDERLLQDCRVRLATSLALRGRSGEAEDLFGKLRYDEELKPLDWPGIRYAWLLMRLKRYDEARDLLRRTITQAQNLGYGIIEARAAALIAELEVRRGDLVSAGNALKMLHSWSSKAIDKEMNLASCIVATSLAIAEGNWAAAKLNIAKGLRLSEEGGYSLYWIELKLREGRFRFAVGDTKGALKSVDQALYGRAAGKTLPQLLGASDAECSYEWGRLEAIELRQLFSAKL